MDKKMFTRMLCLAVGLSVYPACAKRVELSALAERVELPVLRDTVLTDLLTTAELIVERDQGDLFVRIYRLRENLPACTDHPGHCPGERLFIALAAHHSSEQRVFLLPYAVGWENPHFIEGAEKQPVAPPQPHPFIQMTIEEKFIAPPSAEERVKTRQRTLSFNLREARISP